MIQIVRAILFYSTQSAFGNHQFAHLCDSRTTHTFFWLALVASILVNMAILIGITPPLIALLIASLIFLAGLMNLYGFTGPQKLSILSAAAGTLIYCSLLFSIILHFSESTSATSFFMFWFEIVWVKLAIHKNQTTFNRLPLDVRANGYAPGRC